MKNLLFVTQYFPPEIGAGATRAEATVKYLSDSGWNVDVITETANYPMGEPYESVDDINWPARVQVDRTWVWMSKRETMFKKVLFFLSFAISAFLEIIRRPFHYDLILVSSPPIFCALTTLVASKLLRVPLVVEIRDLWPDAAFQTDDSRKSWWYKTGKRLEYWLYRHAEHIIAVTTSSAEIIRKHTSTPVSVVENGVDPNRFKPIPRDQLNLDEPITKGMFRVGFLGSLGVVHDFRTLIEAAKKCEHLSDIEFIVIGDGSKAEEFKSLINTYQPRNLTWHGLKDHHKVPHYISSFDIGLNPIVDAEVFKSIVTVKFYEYLACGTPVISSASGAMEKVSRESSAAWIVPPGNAAALVEKIIVLKNNPDQLDALKQNATEFIRENFDRNVLSAKLEKILGRLIAKR